MTTEAEPRIQEQPATTKRKVQLWFILAVGLVLVILLAMTAVNVFTKLKERDNPAQSESVETEEGAQQQKDFDELVKSRRPRTAEAATEPEQPAMPGSAEQTAGQGKGVGRPSDNPLVKWQLDEQIRALQSAQSQWNKTGIGGAGRTGRSAAVATASTSAPATPGATDEQSLEAKRADVRRRIEEAQRLRARLLDASAVEPIRSNLETVQNSFDLPPTDVAGYTKENSYNADIAGKIKLVPGTEIPVQNMGKAISDYVGPVKVQVTRDVYDSKHEIVVIPKGSTAVFKSVQVQNVNGPIQSRMGFTVTSIVLPDDRVIDLSKAASVVDREGVAAVKDKVNKHYLAQFLGVAAYALIADNSSYQGTGISNDSDYGGEIGESARSQFAPLAQKYLNLVPTITIRPGQTMKIVLESEVYIEPWRNLYANYAS